MPKLKVALIGAGLQAKRRASAVSRAGDEIVVVSAAHEETAKKLADQYQCQHDVVWKRVVARDDADIVIICTPPNTHSEISAAAMNAGKHVLCEKPLAGSSREASAMMGRAKEKEVLLKCGFNVRYHPSISEIRRLVDDGSIGELYYIKATFGIGARPGYEKEWRVNPKYASGGQFMEQGIHLVDLARWFLGEPSEVSAMTSNYFVKTKPFEDNGFVMFRTKEGRVAVLHASLTQWKNSFAFEVTGSAGYVTVNGMGGSYGTEMLSWGKNLPGKPFSEFATEYRGEDKCWDAEWNDFRTHTSKPSQFEYGLDGVRALQVVEAAYESAKIGATVRVPVI